MPFEKNKRPTGQEAPLKSPTLGRVLALIADDTDLRARLWLAAVIALFCALASGVAATKRPWCDEGWLADIAYNLIHHGVMGLTILDPHGFVFAPVIKGIDRYTYWVMPGYILLQAAWYEILGLNLFTMRALSIVSGIVALASWFTIVRHLTQNRAIALISVLVLAVDQHFIVSGASGRMDMMCNALCLAASALYLALRARFHLAVFAACSVLAAALLTHPNAVFGGILLCLIVLWLDRSKIRPRTVLVSAAPFAIALGLWSLYILKAPDIFVSQMQAQARIPHRFAFDWNIFRQFGQELSARYIPSYRLRSSSMLVRLTGSVLLLYFLSIVGLAVVPALRNQIGARLILTLAVIDFTLLSCLQPNWYYLVYVLPAYAAAVGIGAVWLWRRGPAGRWAAAVAIAAIVSLNCAVNGFRILHNDYKNRYIPTVEYLTKQAAPNSLVVGSGELAFNLGFDGRVLDDCRLGFTSRKLPDYIVLEAHYRLFWFSWLSENEPTTFRYMMDVLHNDFELVYDQTQGQFQSLGTSDLPYQIFKRKKSSAQRDYDSGTILLLH